MKILSSDFPTNSYITLELPVKVTLVYYRMQQRSRRLLNLMGIQILKAESCKRGSPNIDLAFTWSIPFQQVVTQIYR